MAPLLWQHMAEFPIGKLVQVMQQTKKFIQGKLSIANTKQGNDAAFLVEFGTLRISHGFKPSKIEQLPVQKGDLWAGFHILEWKMFEVSLVSVPSNDEAIITAFSRQELADPFMKAWAGAKFTRRPAVVKGGYGPNPLGHGDVKGVGPDPVRWNRTQSKAFDVVSQHLEPSTTLIDWVGKYLEVPTKEIFQTSVPVPGVRLGTFLMGLRNALAGLKAEGTRNIYGGSESPPRYEKVQLNSAKSDTFLIEGTTFYRGGFKGSLVIDTSPHYYGVDLTFFTSFADRAAVDEILAKTLEWSEKNNFLKGEAFSLSGEFLPKTGEDWGDLFLEPATEKSVKRVVDRLNAKGKAFANHGMIFCGPPGTGKTLSGRLMLNKSDATFIWISARDLYRAGAFGGISMGFDLAKELAPAVLFIEDVDNWMDNYTVDMMKTEMDGIGRSTGCLTVLTTNFPETLPEALIDRPGRFHDVLQFPPPDKNVRLAMLTKWLPGVSTAKIEDAASRTDGLAGAHLYHLAKFAASLQESEGITADEAVNLAITKTAEQRDLIDGIQLQGSRYRPPSGIRSLGPNQGDVRAEYSRLVETPASGARHQISRLHLRRQEIAAHDRGPYDCAEISARPDPKGMRSRGNGRRPRVQVAVQERRVSDAAGHARRPRRGRHEHAALQRQARSRRQHGQHRRRYEAGPG